MACIADLAAILPPPERLLPGVPAVPDFGQGPQQDPKIELERTVARQRQIQVAALLVGQPAAPHESATGRRGPASLPALRPREAIVQLPLGVGDRPRTHQRHFAPHHVQSCGNSSIECRRQKRAKRLQMRWSRTPFSRGPLSSTMYSTSAKRPAGRAPRRHMVRNFSTQSGLPPRPNRRCAINGDVRESTPSRSPRSALTGASVTSTHSAAIRSSALSSRPEVGQALSPACLGLNGQIREPKTNHHQSIMSPSGAPVCAIRK
jgi:hypothetical protein